MQLITVFYGSFHCITFPSVCWQNREILHCPHAAGSLTKSQWELVQRRFNSEWVTPEEKSDVRKSDASPMGPMGVKMGWGS